MKDNSLSKTFFIIIGSIILGIFISVSMIRLAGVGEYFLSTDIIEKISYSDGKLLVTTREDMVAVCAKQTKSEPAVNSLCWTDTIDNTATISIYEYKTYYFWTKDANNVISYYNKYNVQDNR